MEYGLSFVEYLRTVEVLERFLPDAPATVLDIGGGPGRYAQLLAKRGYTVQLLDPVPLHVEQAQAKLAGFTNSSAQLGDARALPYQDNAADVVLLLGPLYHLQTEEDRRVCLAEAHRVLKKGGLLFAAAISRFAPALNALKDLEASTITSDFQLLTSYLSEDIKTGLHSNPDAVEGNFTSAYFYTPEGLAKDIRSSGFSLEALLALEGLGSALRDVEAVTQNEVKLEKLLRLLRALESEPSVLGVSPHILAVAQK